MKTAIGVDIGGTKTSLVIGDDHGKILAQRVIPTRAGSQARRGLREFVSSLKALRDQGPQKKEIAGIGVGIPGPVDSQKGIVPRSPHLGGWQGVPLKKILEKETRLPVVIANDANAAALGEKFFGHGRNCRDFIYMTISTGIGGGIVLEGKLLEGVSYVAGEIGHMTIVPNGEKCKCGKKGCLEAYASGTAIAAFATREMKKLPASALVRRLAKKGPLTAQKIGMAASQRDPFALGIYRQAGFYLGVGIANLLNVINPAKVILGGGVLKSAPPLFWHSMMAGCKRDAWPQAFKAVRIVRSDLRGHVGDLGALALVFEKFKK